MCEPGGEDVSQVYRRVYESKSMNINFNQNFPIFFDLLIQIYNIRLRFERKKKKNN
jgi:E3 ubiquitin-protein ligase DOA10